MFLMGRDKFFHRGTVMFLSLSSVSYGKREIFSWMDSNRVNTSTDDEFDGY